MEQWFRPMDLNLRVITNSPELDSAVRNAYGRFGKGDERSVPDLEFEFNQKDEMENAGDMPAEPSYRSTALAAELQIGDGVLSINRINGKAHGRFALRVVRDYRAFRLHALHFALSAALAARGFLGIHGACLAIEGRSVLLRGSSGVGKTTLAYAGALRGYQVVAGSTVWIAPDESAWWGIPWWIYLRPSAVALFPEIADAPVVPAGGETRYELDLGWTGAGSTIPCVRPGIVVRVERNPGGATNLEPMSTEEALSLWPEGAAGDELGTPGYSTRVAHLLNRPSYRLLAGDDLGHALDLIAFAAHEGATC